MTVLLSIAQTSLTTLRLHYYYYFLVLFCYVFLFAGWTL